MSLRYVRREARIDRREHERSLCVALNMSPKVHRKKRKKKKKEMRQNRKLPFREEAQSVSLALYGELLEPSLA